MRHLDRQQTVRCKQLRQSSDEVVEARDLREGVVAGNQIGLAALALELVSKVTSEESRQGANSGGFRRPGDILGGLDAQHGNPGGNEVAQQVAIVAAHFDDEAVRSELQLPLHVFGIASDVLEPAGREGREVGVLGEDDVRRNIGRQLDKEAAPAHQDPERIEGLHRVELILAEEALA